MDNTNIDLPLDHAPRPVLNDGTKVRCRQTGYTGRISRSDPATGFMWIYQDRHADDQYRRVEFGPYIMRELEAIGAQEVAA